MKADERHQLKQNELAEALGRLRHFDNPSTRWLLLGLVVLVALVIGWKGWRYSQQQSLEQGWRRLTAIEMAVRTGSAERLATALTDAQSLLNDTSDVALQAAARLWMARAKADEALRNAERREAALKEAVDLLQQILATPGTPAVYEGAAMFALATDSESLNDFDRAKELYAKLTTENRFAGSPWAEMARTRLETLDSLRVTVDLAPGNPPAPATQPFSVQFPQAPGGALPPEFSPVAPEPAPQTPPAEGPTPAPVPAPGDAPAPPPAEPPPSSSPAP